VAVASPRLVPCKRNHLSGGCGSRTILQRTILQHRQGHNHRHHAEGAGRDRPEMWSPPASVYVTAMSLVSLANAGLSELRGEHMASYSKFRHVVGAAGVGTGRQQQRGALVRRAGRRGRRARAAAQRRARRPLPQTGSEGNSKDFVLQSFHHTPRAPKFRGVLPKICDNAFAIQVPCSAGHMQQSYIYIYIYFNVLEICSLPGPVHPPVQREHATRYGGDHFLQLPAQHGEHDLRAAPLPGPPGPAIGLPYPGVLVFAVGIAGNLYHHYLLSRLRSGSSGGDKGHRIPRGGLFELVTCPHYLFEIIGLFGFAMISQTTPWPLALLRTSPAGAAPPGGGISPSSRCEI
jgi:hypothetical protein